MAPESEKWTLHKLGLEWGLTCFVTGCYDSGDLKDNIVGFVDSKEAGERVVDMFNGRAFLDYRPKDPNWIQVKVGALPEHKNALKTLYDLVVENDNVITPDIIAKAKAVPALTPKRN